MGEKKEDAGVWGEAVYCGKGTRKYTEETNGRSGLFWPGCLYSSISAPAQYPVIRMAVPSWGKEGIFLTENFRMNVEIERGKPGVPTVAQW